MVMWSLACNRQGGVSSDNGCRQVVDWLASIEPEGQVGVGCKDWRTARKFFTLTEAIEAVERGEATESERRSRCRDQRSSDFLNYRGRLSYPSCGVVEVASRLLWIDDFFPGGPRTIFV